jgi:ubiquitin-protein ligase
MNRKISQEKKNARIAAKNKKRIEKEIKRNKESKDFEFTISPNNKDLWYFKFTPEDGPYKGQNHIVRMKLRYGSNVKYTYPFYPPKCDFITKIYHANVSINSGAICLDSIKDNWTPVMKTASVIDAINVLLLKPNPSSPLNANAAKTLRDKHRHKKMIISTYKKSNVGKKILELFDIEDIEGLFKGLNLN